MLWLHNEVNMLKSIGIDSSILLLRDVPLDRAREIIAEAAVRDGWQYIFFLDSDVIPPPGITYVMLSLRAPAVCSIYPLKIGVLSAYYFDEVNKIVKPLEPQRLRELQNTVFIIVDACALGAVLLDSYIFKRLRKPWFRFMSEDVVHMMTLDKIRVEYNEDVYFFIRLKRELGIQPLAITKPALHELLTGLSLDPFDPTRTLIPMERLDFVPLLQQLEQKGEQKG
jgi:hypothetical protein